MGNILNEQHCHNYYKKYYKINFLNQHGLCVKLVFGENF